MFILMYSFLFFSLPFIFPLLLLFSFTDNKETFSQLHQQDWHKAVAKHYFHRKLHASTTSSSSTVPSVISCCDCRTHCLPVSHATLYTINTADRQQKAVTTLLGMKAALPQSFGKWRDRDVNKIGITRKPVASGEAGKAALVNCLKDLETASIMKKRFQFWH